MVDHFQTEWFSAALDRTSDSTHAQNTERFALRVMAKCDTFLEIPFSEIGERGIQLAQRAEEEEDGQVGSRTCHGVGSICDCNFASGACIDVDLVVAGAIVTDEFQRCGEVVD